MSDRYVRARAHGWVNRDVTKGPIVLRLLRVLMVRTLCIGMSAAWLSGCGGSHATLPPVANGTSPFHAVTTKAASVSTDIVAIDAGGAASGTFAADEYYSGSGQWDYSVTSTIATTGITTPAPQAVYQSQRTGASITYTIPGLTPGASYNVILSFAELYFTAAKQRVFNVSINNTQVLRNFDIFATAGARDKAISESLPATAGAGGTIAIVLTATADNAVINAIEIAPAATPTPSATPAAGVFIDAGGAATGSFTADTYFSAGSWTYATSGTVSTAGVSSPAPPAVYQSARDGAALTYTIPGLTAGASYSVRLDFAELWWTATGQRIFNVSINNATALTNFDIVAAAGGPMKAVAKTFAATAAATGTITIALTSVKDNANINAIEITPASAPTPAPSPSPSPTSGTAATFNDYTTFGYDNTRDVFNPNTTASRSRVSRTCTSRGSRRWATAIRKRNPFWQPRSRVTAACSSSAAARGTSTRTMR